MSCRYKGNLCQVKFIRNFVSMQGRKVSYRPGACVVWRFNFGNGHKKRYSQYGAYDGAN